MTFAAVELYASARESISSSLGAADREHAGDLHTTAKVAVGRGRGAGKRVLSSDTHITTPLYPF